MKNRFPLAFVIVVLLPGWTYATDDEKGFFAGVNSGRFDVDDLQMQVLFEPEDLLLRAFDRIELDDSGKYVGAEMGYRFNRYLTFAGEYRMGSGISGRAIRDQACIGFCNSPIDRGRVEADYQSVSLSMTGTYPLTERVELLGELGLARSELELSRQLGSLDSTDTLLGLGVRLSLSDNWALQLNGQRHGDIESVGVGMQWGLGGSH